jgi:hypothetical protein
MPSSNFIWDKLISENAKDAAPDYASRPFLDKAQLALGMYAKPGTGGVVSDKIKKLMRYHGVSGLEPTNDPKVASFKRNGRNVLVRLED